MRRTKLVAALLYCLSVAPSVSLAAGTVVAANAIQSETIVVRVRLNTEDKGDVFVERTQDGDFLVKVADLKAMGIRDPQGPSIVVDGQPHLSLKAMQGVSFAFQEKGLTLSITADPALLPSRSLTMDGRRGRVRGEIPKGGSGFFNYALHATANDSGAPSGATFSGELGWRLGDYLFLSDATTTQNVGHRHKFIRLMTSVTHDDREELRRTIFGDFFTPSRDFSTGVNLGGIGISKLYSLNPFFVQFPTQSVGGTVALPTDMEVYLNGQRIRNEKLQPGQFQLTDIAAYGGAQNVQVVLRDAFGRVQQLNYSFYFSDQPLRKGLHEYSYNAGAMRRSYGNRSNEYGPLAATMFHRYGFSDALTLGVRAETARDFFNAGPIATVVLGDAGVLGGALAVSSTAGHTGGAGLLSYTYSTKKWSIGGSMRRDWRDYATLADPATMTNRKVEANLSASYFLGEYGSISLSHSRLSVRAGIASASATPAQPFSVLAMGPRRVTALSYSVPLMSGRASLSASLSHINDQASPGGRNEAFVGLIVFLSKDYSVAASHRGDQTTHNQSVQFTKNQPAGEGLGFILSGTRSTDPAGEALQGRSSVQYNAPAAVFRAELAHSRSQFGQTSSDYSVSAAGGIGFAGGTIGFGRPIVDSFGIVTVGQLPGIEVTVNGHSVGKTNARGQVFVPTLTPYFDNDVWIATDRIPIDYSIHSRLKTVSPSLRGGAVIEFPVTKLQAFSGHLKYRQGGTIKPAEFRAIRIEAEGRKLVFDTGRGGEFYIENLKPGTYPASVEIEGKACPFNLSIPASTETFVELGDIECRSAP